METSHRQTSRRPASSTQGALVLWRQHLESRIARRDDVNASIPIEQRYSEQDDQGARWMPWHRKPTKDAASCDNPRGGASSPRSAGVRMGEPARGHALAAPAEHIGRRRATGGTETSQYPEEEKSNEIPRVAASERGPAQTRARVRALGRCCTRGCGVARPGSQITGRSHKSGPQRNRHGRAGRRG